MNLPNDKNILAALVGNEIRELPALSPDMHPVRFLTLRDADGERIYQRGLVFLFYVALKELYPDAQFRVIHSLSQGIYMESSGHKRLTEKELERIEQKMHELVHMEIPFRKIEVSMAEAKQIYHDEGLSFKAKIIEYKHNPITTLYECMGYHHYFYGYMPPHTGYLRLFELVYYAPGFVLRHPNNASPEAVPPFVEQAKTHAVHMESEHWGELMHVGNVTDLNYMIEKHDEQEIIQVNEALHEKKIAAIADAIVKSGKLIILISGPSSSGKTTFAERLKIQLMTSGIIPQSISLDNYFVNREDTPRDEQGNYDFEALEALDIELLNLQLKDLLQGKRVHLPSFDFYTGTRSFREESFWLRPRQPLLLEGIHALNEKLSRGIFHKDKFKIYVSALTQLNLDEHNRIPTTDNRLIRRMVRDHRTRGYTAMDTLSRWESVRRGEQKHIFPYQEEADAIFNSALVYELAVLKKYALPLLEAITPDHEMYYQAKRLKKFLYYFRAIEDEKYIPSTSILREFIGSSSLDV